MKFQYIYLFLFSVILFSCSDDLGNYKYRTINEINIDVPRNIVAKIPKKDSTIVTISPIVTQTLMENNDNLSYQWKISNKGVWEVKSTAQNYDFAIYPSTNTSITVWLTVTDNILNISSQKQITVSFSYGFSRSWFILQDVDNLATLGNVDGTGEYRTVDTNIYLTETGTQLEGKPLFLGINNVHFATPLLDPEPFPAAEPVLGIFTDTKSFILNGSTLEERYSIGRLLFDKRESMDFNITCMKAENPNGEAFIDNGTLWFSPFDGYSLFYPVRLAESAGSSCRIKDICLPYGYESINILFDEENGRFLSYKCADVSADLWTRKKIVNGSEQDYNPLTNLSNAAEIQLIGESSKFPNQFNPNNVRPVSYMAPTSSSSNANVLAVAKDPRGSMFYVYELSPSAIAGDNTTSAFCSGYWSISAASETQSFVNNDQVSFASSVSYDRMFFYAAGNKIYRVDLNRATPEIFTVYTYPDETCTLKCLKFQSERKDLGYKANPDDEKFTQRGLPTYLGVIAENELGEASLVEMHLTVAGDITKNSDGQKEVYEFSGFKNVTDIIYSFRIE